MENKRLTQLLEMEKSNNEDVTIKYMIALEYLNANNTLCEMYFDLILSRFPDYLPVYYIAGEYFYNRDQNEKSLFILKKGVDVAERQKNKKALDEILNLKMNVEIEL